MPALDRLDESLIEAAEDWGVSRLKAFWLLLFRCRANGLSHVLPCIYSRAGRVCDPVFARGIGDAYDCKSFSRSSFNTAIARGQVRLQ